MRPTDMMGPTGTDAADVTACEVTTAKASTKMTSATVTSTSATVTAASATSQGHRGNCSTTQKGSDQDHRHRFPNHKSLLHRF
jgi:hypothetical protein